MEFLVFLFIISNINLVLTEDKTAKEITLAHQDIYKVHSDPEEISQSDQIAESSRSIAEAYKVMHPNPIQTPVGKLNDVRQEMVQNTARQEVPLQENSRQNSVVEVLQPALTQGYAQPQPIYVQQYPLETVQILGAQASPLKQTQESGHKTLGYSSYVEHVSQKDEEEMKSALMEGSIKDIERLVPKSGISFKIYQNDKNVENQKTSLHSKALENYSQTSKFQHRIQAEAPASQFKVQNVYQEPHQPMGGLDAQQSYIKTDVEEKQRGYENPQLQSVGGASSAQDQQDVIGQTHYYAQQPIIINHPELNSQKNTPEAIDQSSFTAKPHFQITVDENNYGKTTAELNSVASNRGSKHSLADISNLQYQKQWRYDSKSEGSQKAVKNTKPPILQYDRSFTGHAERTRPLNYAQNHDSDLQNSVNKYKTPKSYSEISKGNANAHRLSNSYAVKTNQNGFVEHLADKAYFDKETAQGVINRFLENHLNTENAETGQNHIIGHLGTNVYDSTQSLKDIQRDRFSVSSYTDSETAKSSQHSLISHFGKGSYVETKNGQNNFDHQKALEGSTSFDIKNAIDNTKSFINQPNYVSPGEQHPIEDIHKQQLAYIIPKIPTSTFSVDSGIHDVSIGEKHQIKDLGQAGITSSYLSYQPVFSSETSGKFPHQPQNVVWTPEYLKQENALTANDFHQPLLRLHFPKEENYQHVKTASVELPTSSISHFSYQQQKQPYVLHYDVPLVKHPQEIHFQPKFKTRSQNNQAGLVKLTQPVAIDWTLFKTTLPNFSINSLALKPDFTSHLQEPGKKIVPILIRKRKNRSSNKQEIGVVYGKISGNRRPSKPTHRHEKNVHVNLHPETTSTVKQSETNGERKNEFSVSAFYKVDRSLKSPNSS